MTLAAIARRRKLLNDDVIISLAEASWDILDISGSDVSDHGLAKVAERCKSLGAIDISRCSKITPLGVSELVQCCNSLETLRCGYLSFSKVSVSNFVMHLNDGLFCIFWIFHTLPFKMDLMTAILCSLLFFLTHQ